MHGRELFQEAQLLLINGKHGDSAAAFTRAIQAGFDAPVAYLSRGVARLQAGDYGGAEEDFTRVIELDEKNSRAYYYRGVLKMIKEDFLDAVQNLTAAIKLKKSHGVAFFARGTALTHLGKEEEGMRDIKSAIALSEAETQGFIDTFGILRTQFDKVLALASAEGGGPASNELTGDETRRLKKLLDGD